MSVEESYDFIVSEGTKLYGKPMQQITIAGISSTTYLTENDPEILVNNIEGNILASDFINYNNPSIDISKSLTEMSNNDSLPKITNAKNITYLHSSGAMINIQQMTTEVEDGELPIILVQLIDMNKFKKTSSP